MLDRTDPNNRRATLADRDEYGRHLETGTEARQAFLGRPVFYVLVGGLILAALFLIATQIWNVSEDTPPPGAIESGAVSGVVAPAASGAAPAAIPAPPVNVAPPAAAPVDPAPAPASAAPVPPANPPAP